jgi:acyl transferase domain-containing protein/NADPH:quinone reductase-like Zn-dependent oxidoreductase/NAD(P)-dependent dehydrogenase (short-subunit alcohol dehydrogenase family)/acyl carrier protein
MLKNMPLAICSYAHRLPGGLLTDNDFWRLLENRKRVREDVRSRYGRGLLPVGKYSNTNLHLASAYEAFITDNKENQVDPMLFGMSMLEATSMEPQQRMMLGCAWEAFERAGWSGQSLRNSETGVFLGCQTPNSATWRSKDGGSFYDVMMTSMSMVANRLSFHFNLKGPSIAHATACSAGLTALYAAERAILFGDCRQALVGAVNYLGSGRLSVGFTRLGIISPNGRCYTLDERANGYVRSEGAFAYTVKPLHLAEEDGDEILAVVEATAVNTAGAADRAQGLAPGRFISAPTQHSQVEVMQRAMALANRSPEEIDYVEMHATGTSVGDVIEGNAVAEAYGDCGREIPLRICSVKSNLGHMEAAAFCGSLLKVLLMIQRRTYAPISKSFSVPNPDIDFEKGPMVVQRMTEPFPDKQVVFGISSFGFGGANGHCIVSEYAPELKQMWSIPVAPQMGYMIPLSARSKDALVQSVKDFNEHLSSSSISIYTLAGNLSRRRTHDHARIAFSALTVEELQTKFEAFLEHDTPSINHATDGPKRVAFVFTGQGTQWAGCGKILYDTNPVFKRVIDTIEELWCQYSSTSLREVCFNASQELLDQVHLAQSVVFLIQVALVELLKTWGVYPDVVFGHSSGEVAAAYSCGLLSLEDAVRVVYCRAEAQKTLEGSGRMLPISLGHEGVQQLLSDLGAKNVEIVCLNSPASTVVAGPQEALEPVIAACQERKLHHTLLRGNIAFHSSAMDRIKDTILNGMAFLNKGSFRHDVPFVSTVTGKEIDQLDARYWWKNVRQPVRFLDAVETIREHYDPDIYIEVSPERALSPMVAQCYELATTSFPITLPTLMRDGDGRRDLLDTLGGLFSAGFVLDYAEQYPRPLPVTKHLPGHPVRWIDDTRVGYDEELYNKSVGFSHGPIVGKQTIEKEDIFESILKLDAFPFLKDHQVEGVPILPAMCYVELVLEALGGDTPIKIDEIEFFAQCPVTEDGCSLRTTLVPVNDQKDVFDFKISTYSFDRDAEEELHAWGRARRFDSKDWASDGPQNISEIDPSKFPNRLFEPVESFYDVVDAVLSGLYYYGPDFRILTELKSDDLELDLYAEIEVDAELFDMARDAGYVFLPQVLDAGVQTFLFILIKGPDLFSIPQRAKNITYIKPPTSNRLICHITPNWTSHDYDHRGQHAHEYLDKLSGSCRYYDAITGELLLEVGEYYSRISQKDVALTAKTKYITSWQSKSLQSVPRAALEPGALIRALPHLNNEALGVHRIVEYVGSKDPQSSLLHSNCLDALSGTQHEYWLISDTNELIREYYSEFGHLQASIRVIEQDLTDADSVDFKQGVLGEHSVSLVLLSDEPHTYAELAWQQFFRLLVPQGLVLVPCTQDWSPPEGCRIVARDDHALLLQVVPSPIGSQSGDKVRWILGEDGSLAEDWAVQHPNAFVIHDFDQTQTFWNEVDSVESIDFFCSPEPDPKDPVGEKLTWKFLSFIQTFVTHRTNQKEAYTRISVVTQGAAFQVTNPRASVLWGAIRCIGLEHGTDVGIDFQIVDVGDASDLDMLKWASERYLRERELAIRSGSIWVPRLVRIPELQPIVPEDEEITYSLRLKTPSQISGMEWQARPVAPLGADEVEIEVAAAPLNFRDIMVILNLLPPLAYERSALGRVVGIEGSGVVARTGDQVASVAVGDRVCYTGSNAIANRLVLPEWLLYKVPKSCSLLNAASSMSVLQTAYFALIHQARMQPKHTVLIHSAMGGVGQMAIQLVKMTGASFYATAGNKQKRAKLRSMGALGVFNSHSLEWHRDLMEATGGNGVDIVLNSLAGQHLPLCLDSLSPGGWHCEIGKVDIFANNRIGMRILRKNLNFSAIDMDRLALDDPQLVKKVALECIELIGNRKIEPPEITRFDYGDQEKALQFMMSGKHEGKLVLIPPKGKRDFPVVDMRSFFDATGTYLVTGASGGLGATIARYLVFCGAKHITLIDRNPDRTSNAVIQLNASREKGLIPRNVEVDVVYGQVTNFEEMKSVVANLDRPLKGVFHLAGTLNDQLLVTMTEEAVNDVFEPKALGAWNLHNATKHLKTLDHFVMFSSTACLLGNAGQSNYAAANAFMDALAELRKSQGLPALAFSLAGIRDQGMASRTPHILRSMDALGLPAISTTTAIANLDYALRTMPKASHIASFSVENPTWSMEFPDYLRIGHLQSNQSAFSKTRGLELTVKGVLELLTEKLSKLSGHDEIHPESLFSDYGLTSVSVTELSAFIQATFGYRAGVLELMTSATPLLLAEAIVEASTGDGGGDDKVEEDTMQEQASETLRVGETIRKRSVFALSTADHFKTDEELACQSAGDFKFR